MYHQQNRFKLEFGCSAWCWLVCPGGAGLSACLVLACPPRQAMKRYCLSSEFADAIERGAGSWRPLNAENDEPVITPRHKWFMAWPVCWCQRDAADKWPVCNHCWKLLFKPYPELHGILHTWWLREKDYYYRNMFDEVQRDVREARKNGWDPGPRPPAWHSSSSLPTAGAGSSAQQSALPTAGAGSSAQQSALPTAGAGSSTQQSASSTAGAASSTQQSALPTVGAGSSAQQYVPPKSKAKAHQSCHVSLPSSTGARQRSRSRKRRSRR